MFERALSCFPATASLWLQYGTYLEGSLKIPGLVAALWERAVRNCPWMGAMWVRAMRALDRQAADVGKVYKAAMAAGLQVCTRWGLRPRWWLHHCCDTQGGQLPPVHIM